MKRIFNWSEWNIAAKILFPFLGLSITALSIVSLLAFTNIERLGRYAMDTETALGEKTINESTAALNKIGEVNITQKANDVAKQVEMYLDSQPVMTAAEMRNDGVLRAIAVQPVGTTGYTAILDHNNMTIVIHKYPEMETDLWSLKDSIPAFQSIIVLAAGGGPASGYYDWQEVDGSIRKKFASIVPIQTRFDEHLTLWATTYIDEFSRPSLAIEQNINAQIANHQAYVNNNVGDIQKMLIIVVTFLVGIVAAVSLLLSRVITRPILELKRGAEAFGEGKLEYKIPATNKDELGELASSFNQMGFDLKNYMEELKSTAAENIAREKEIQENLRLYAHKASQAQEAERKRIARELHDDTAQSLIVVTRHLDELAAGNGKLTIQDIRNEIKNISAGVRQFSQQLRPSILDDLGLIPAIKSLAADITQNNRIVVDTTVFGDPRQLPPDTEIIIFRIAQEALTNIRRHSGATKVSIDVEFTGEKVKITIKDNGCGFNMPSEAVDLTRKGKLGLVGMQERTQLMGGTLNIKSQPGEGTTITLEVKI